MPINNADIPIADNEPEIKIDNPIEHAYLYRVISSPGITNYVGLKFYKYKQKFNGLDTFISNNGVYYIWANRSGGNAGEWVISTKIGNNSGGPPERMYQNNNLNFFTTKVPVEGTYTNFVTLVLGKITN